jgi:hypothetical protein
METNPKQIFLLQVIKNYETIRSDCDDQVGDQTHVKGIHEKNSGNTGRLAGENELRSPKSLFSNICDQHSLRRVGSANNSALVVGARWSGENPPSAPSIKRIAPLITHIEGAHRSSRSASSARPPRLKYFCNHSSKLEPRSHRARRDLAQVANGAPLALPGAEIRLRQDQHRTTNGR